MAGRLLIVDPDSKTRLAMVELLAGAGYDAVGVGSFEEARDALRWLRPDLLITEVRLREYNGLHLLLGSTEPVRTIVVTAFPDPVLEAEARAHGAAWLLKPVSPFELRAAIQEMLAQAAPRPRRRWERRRVTKPVSARVDGTTARLVEVSYGGARVEFEGASPRAIPSSFTMAVADVAVPVDVVWQRAAGEQRWAYGVALAHLNDPAASSWFKFVDAVA